MPAPTTRSAFRERLGMYLLGLAIGLVIMGFMFMARQNAARQRLQHSQPAPTATEPRP